MRNSGTDLGMVRKMRELKQFRAIRLIKAKVLGASMETGQPARYSISGLATELACHYHRSFIESHCGCWGKDGG